MVVKDGRGKGKPVRHSVHRTPTPTQQARWEAVQQAREKRQAGLFPSQQHLAASPEEAGDNYRH